MYAKHMIVLIRTGSSVWNEKNLFCGWYDSKLTAKGILNALIAGKRLKKSGLDFFDVAYTSTMSRAQTTLKIILSKLGKPEVKTVKTWRLNGRHWGALTGLNFTEAVAKYGTNTLSQWRTNYDALPPPLEPTNPYYRRIVQDPRYEKDLLSDQIPKSESLKMVVERVEPLWNTQITGDLRRGKRVLIVAHEASLMALTKIFGTISDHDFFTVDIRKCTPLVYNLSDGFNWLDGGIQRDKKLADAFINL